MERLKRRVIASKAWLNQIEIPAIPESIMKLDEIYRSKFINSYDVIKVIKSDSTISGELIKTVNSRRFKLRNPVESVEQAVDAIGAENPELLNILKAAAFKSFVEGSNSYKTAKEILEYCADVAYVCHEIAEVVEGLDKHQAYTFGLFADVGYLILASKEPKYADYQIKALSVPEKALESEISMGADHVTVGYIVANYWLLPKWMQHAILLHHDGLQRLEGMDTLQPKVVDFVAIMKIATYLVAEVSFGSYISQDLLDQSKYAQWFLGIDDDAVSQIRRTFIVDTISADAA